MAPAGKPTPQPTFFRTAAAFRQWLAKHGHRKTELIVGFYKKHSGKGGLTYAEAVDEALCAGWIDGIVRRIDDDAYCHRFTPRTATSTWSQVNLRRVQVLIAEGRMTPAGLAAWERRKESTAPAYSHEQTEAPEFSPAHRKRFKAAREAWAWFQSARASYQRAATLWVLKGKQDATRERRFQQLLDHSARGEAVPPFIERRPVAKRRVQR